MNILKFNSVKANLTPALLVGGGILLSACSGSGDCLSQINNSAPTTSAKLDLTAPNLYPAGIALTIPAVVRNIGDSDLNNITYSIPASSNDIGVVVIPRAGMCNSIPKHQQCILPLDLPAGSVPGAFSLMAAVTPSIKGATHSNSLKSLDTEKLQIIVSVGLTNMPANTTSGADGLDILAPTALVANQTSETKVEISTVVKSNLAGIFNTIALVDKNNQPLEYETLTNNSGNGFTNLATNSVVTFLATVPNGANALQFRVQTLENGKVLSTGSNLNTIQVNHTPLGIAVLQPNNFALTPTRTTQAVTIYNTGNAALTNLQFTPTAPLTAASNDCTTSLAPGSVCTYSVAFDPQQPGSGTAPLVINYNDGQNNLSATATAQYQAQLPGGGISISSSTNPNFDFATTTATSSMTSQITVTNSSAGSETVTSFTTPPSYFSLNRNKLANPCPSLPFNLNPGKSCTLNIVYTNASLVPASTAVITANYTYAGGQKTGTTSIGVTYQTTQAQAILALTPTGVANFGTILNDGTATSSRTITLSNQGDAAANNVNASLSSGTSYSITSNTCPVTIPPGNTCTIGLNFGPSIAAAGTLNDTLSVNYTPYPSATATSTSKALTGILATPQSAIFNPAAGAITAHGFAAGTSGTSANPYQAAQNSAPAPTITATVTNSGAVPANQLVVSTPGLSAGWNLASTSCGTGAAPGTLAAGASCQIQFGLTTAAAPGPYNLDLSGVQLAWQDQANPGGTTQNLSGIEYASIYAPASINLAPNNLSINTGQTATISATLSGGYNVPNQTVSLSSSSAPGDVTLSSSPSPCTLSAASPSCNFNVAVSPTATAGNYTLNVANTGSVVTTPNNLNFTIAAGGWQFVGTRTNTTNTWDDPSIATDGVEGYYTSLAFSSSNQPYVAFTDGIGGPPWLRTFNGTTWVNAGTANPFISPNVEFTSLAINPTTNEPTIAFENDTTSGTEVMFLFANGMWHNMGATPFTGNASNQNLIFGPDPVTGTTIVPYVAFTELATAQISVMYFDGANWQYLGNPKFSTVNDDTSNSSRVGFAFNPSTHQPYVAYADNANSDKVTVMAFDGANWNLVNSAGFSHGSASYISLAFNPATNEPYVFFSECYTGCSNKGSVMKYNGTSWGYVGSPEFTAGVASYMSVGIAFNPSTNQPYVAYDDYDPSAYAGNGTGGQSVMAFNGTSWALVGARQFSGTSSGNGDVQNSWLAFNPSTNQPYVAFTSGINGATPEVMYYH